MVTETLPLGTHWEGRAAGFPGGEDTGKDGAAIPGVRGERRARADGGQAAGRALGDVRRKSLIRSSRQLSAQVQSLGKRWQRGPKLRGVRAKAWLRELVDVGGQEGNWALSEGRERSRDPGESDVSVASIGPASRVSRRRGGVGPAQRAGQERCLVWGVGTVGAAQ